MINLNSIMTSNVVTVSPETVMIDAVAIMEQNSISALVVVENELPVGIFTERSLLHLTISGHFNPNSLIHEVMTHKPVLANSDIDIHEAYLLFQKHKIRHLIIVDNNGTIKGIITETDIIKGLQSEYINQLKQVIDNQIVQLQTVRKQLNDKIIETNKRLKNRSEELKETNAALWVLLKQRETDKEEITQSFQQNIETLVLPFFNKLRNRNTSPSQENIIKSIENNLRQITSPFVHRLSNIYSNLTPAEIQVANLIKNGHSSKEISSLLNLSSKTIYTHRRNIRKKSGITNQKTVSFRQA